ncbi:MAG: exosortase/archaeosortase family protein [Akkermansiaceae bacterium]|nr:exosortase/archaeosortase family protein [Akkermansiaceae bacterium]
MDKVRYKNYILPVALIATVILVYWLIIPIYPNSSTSKDRLILYIADAWKKDFVHGWAVPFLFVFFVYRAWPKMALESVKGSVLGLLGVLFAVLLFVASVRTLQPRLPLIGLPFLIVGSVMYVYGWKVARHMLFPAFFWYFALSVPGLQQATNVLQIAVTKSCYHVGTFCGMDLINSGTTIRPASGSWDDLDIAEGCSGIRSLMALVMISAIYAYFTQKSLWKMAVLFACALPLALVANFFRIFTILVLANMGFSKFAAGAYHDWAGLLFFFPIALAGLFMIDKLLNWKSNRKVVRTRRVE